MKAIWKGQVIAESDKTLEVEGNYYFPPESINKDLLQKSKMSSTCPWKGKASYFDVVVDGQTNPDAAWFYPDPLPKATYLKDYVAFWKGVEIKP